MSRTTASLVCYKTSLTELEPLLRSLREDPSIDTWVVVDNAAAEDPTQAERLRELTHHYGGIYVAPIANIGFGAGHNAALEALRNVPSAFHLIVNPDIVFGRDVLPALTAVMDAQPRVGLIMPRVFYPDGTTQYLCRLLPTPLDSILRRFAPDVLQRLAQRSMDRYELREMDCEQSAQIPFLAGCFMFTRRSVLESVGGFDERYFLYLEDVDLCRRLSTVSELLYWPAVSIVHTQERGSHKNFKLMLTHTRSAILYFNKWGWFFDADRTRINNTALAQLPRKKS